MIQYLEGQVKSSHSCALKGAGGACAVMQHSDSAMVLTEMLLELAIVEQAVCGSGGLRLLPVL